MSTTHRVILLTASNAAMANQWLDGHPELDFRGGGLLTFTVKLALLGDPDDGSITRYYWCGWRMSQEMWDLFETEALDNRAWKVNSKNPNNDMSWYVLSFWTRQEILDDLTRKPVQLRVVPIEV